LNFLPHISSSLESQDAVVANTAYMALDLVMPTTSANEKYSEIINFSYVFGKDLEC